MYVGSIQSNDNRRSVIVPMTQGAAIGAVAGLVGKYALPLQYDETHSDEYISVKNKINVLKKEYNIRTQKYIDSLRAKPTKTLAEDEFVKMFDGMKDGDRLKHSKIGKAIENIKNISKGNSDNLLEFKRLCNYSAQIAEQTAKQCLDAYNLVTKHIRPTGFFVVTGAIVGAFIALINDVLKTEVKK
jgi:hypothetical protein